MSQHQHIQLELESVTRGITQDNTYNVVLGEREGTRKLVIIIGNNEASSIAMIMHNMKPARPFSHDLLKNIIDLFNATVEEVCIHTVREGIFYAEIVCQLNGKEYRIDSRTSDAIALAIRVKCPIYVHPDVMNEVGIETQEQAHTDSDTESTAGTQADQGLQKLSLEDLEIQLDEAVQSEDYELAARIRDEIQNRKA